MGIKLHPPYPNQDCLPVQNLDLKSALQCLKNGNMWSCAGIGRFSLWHSWLIWAKRLADLADLALNARAPTAPNSSLSTCSYMAAILCTKELNSFWASSTVSWVIGMEMITINLNVICNVGGVNRMPKHIYTQWNLRANCPWNWKSKPQEISCVIHVMSWQRSKE